MAKARIENKNYLKFATYKKQKLFSASLQNVHSIDAESTKKIKGNYIQNQLQQLCTDVFDIAQAKFHVSAHFTHLNYKSFPPNFPSHSISV